MLPGASNSLCDELTPHGEPWHSNSFVELHPWGNARFADRFPRPNRQGKICHSRSPIWMTVDSPHFYFIIFGFAGIAQLVERNLAKVEVASSRLVSRSIFSWFLRDRPRALKRLSKGQKPNCKGSQRFPFFSAKIPCASQRVQRRLVCDVCNDEPRLCPSRSSSAYPGGVAEWLCSGLQSRLCRFDSDPRLQIHDAADLRASNAFHHPQTLPRFGAIRVRPVCMPPVGAQGRLITPHLKTNSCDAAESQDRRHSLAKIVRAMSQPTSAIAFRRAQQTMMAVHGPIRWK